MSIKHLFFAFALVALGCQGCGEEPSDGPKDPPKPKPKAKVVVPAFDGDSAFAFVQKQVDFGPRNPGSVGHTECAEWLAEKLGSYADSVILQKDRVTAYDGTQMPMINVIGQFQPEKKRRILLFAHWDTRPIADKDPDESRRLEPILGANDGASGVGVLMEIARQLAAKPTNYGIDIIFFDAEDNGAPQDYPGDYNPASWCLGSQYWSRSQHVAGYRAKYGILLDMVGSKTASFPKEGTSMEFASHVMRKIFKAADKTENSQYFEDRTTGPTIDDHTFINQMTGIPSACIVEYHQGVNAMGLQGYGAFHHTHNDNMDVISAETLEAVGETVMHVIYNE